MSYNDDGDVSALAVELLSSLIDGIDGLPGSSAVLGEAVGVICLRTDIDEIDQALCRINDAFDAAGGAGPHPCLIAARASLVAARTVRTLDSSRTLHENHATLVDIDLGECPNPVCDNGGEIPLHSKTVEENGVRHASECAWCSHHFRYCPCPTTILCPDCDSEEGRLSGKASLVPAVERELWPASMTPSGTSATRTSGTPSHAWRHGVGGPITSQPELNHGLGPSPRTQDRRFASSPA